MMQLILPMFHQVEGIYIDKDVNFANLRPYPPDMREFVGTDLEIRFRHHTFLL